MSNRLDQERQAKLEPQRMQSCKARLTALGFTVVENGHTELQFEFKGSLVKFWPYSGWHSGKTIKDGRGFNNLLEQLR